MTPGRWLPADTSKLPMGSVTVPRVPPPGAYRYDTDGVPWYQAPIPGRWHRCRRWTTGRVGNAADGLMVDRCACGAARLDGGPWLERNERRRERRRARRR